LAKYCAATPRAAPAAPASTALLPVKNLVLCGAAIESVYFKSLTQFGFLAAYLEYTYAQSNMFFNV